MSLVIKNGSVFMKGILHDVDVLIEEGKITKIGKDLSGEKIVDAKGLTVLPGVIDPHVHCRDFSQSEKEDFFTVSCAAAKGGITTIFAMPNTDPPVLTIDVLEEERKRAQKSVVNYGLYMCGARNSEEIKKAKNIPGVKIYLDVTTGNMKVEDEEDLNKLFSSHKRIAVHAEDHHVIESINRINKTEGKLYLCHISAKEEIETIREHKNEKIFCEVSPHHLFLTNDDEKELKGFGMMKPVLKTKEDQKALWKGISDGTVDTIGTDHAPHTKEEKESDNPPWGVPGLETSLPLMLTAVNEKRLTLKRVVQLMCENPAKIFDMKNKGRIEEGYDADIVLVDMNKEGEVKNEELLTKCGWSPFNGKVLKGWPTTTIVNGNIVYDGKVHDIKGKEVSWND